MPPFPSARPYSTDPRNRCFPPLGASQADLLAFRDRLINPWSVFRNSHLARIGQSMWYFLGKQWSEFDYSVAFDGVRGAFLKDLDEDATNTVVRPVTNESEIAVEAEVIALVKRRWIPKAVPTSSDPRIKAAAQVSNNRLNTKLEKIGWREKRHQHALHFAAGGLGLSYTGWDKSYLELKPVGSLTAVRCSSPGCETKLYSSQVPVDTLRAPMSNGQSALHLEQAKPAPAPEDYDPNAIEEAILPYCPTCPSPSPLTPYTPTPEEAADGVDLFGRPLGDDAPAGDDTLEIDVPWEFYPENAGAKTTPDTMRLWGRRKIRTQEWIEERYPHLIDQVHPDTISELIYGDPILGSGDMFSSFSVSLDAGILDYHNNVDEMVQLPSYRYPLGRYTVCTKDVVLEDSSLLEPITVPDPYRPTETVTVYVPRVQMSAARFKIRPSCLWGTTILDHIISPQNRLNGLDSQLIETRLRFGPHISIPSDMWPMGGATIEDAPGVGNFILLNSSVQNPQAVPTVFHGITMPDSVYLERNAVQADIQRSIAHSRASAGDAKGVSTSSGLQLMLEQDDRNRSLREDELVNSVEKSWSHLLQMEWTLGADNMDEYEIEESGGVRKYEQYKGSMLAGQYQVKIEKGSFITRSVMQREATREALADGAVVIDSPVARRKLAANYGLDTDINEDTTNQVDHAERVWIDFEDKGFVRTQDPLDDPALHYHILGTHLRTDKGERLADEAGWEEINRALAGWEDEFRLIVTAEAKSIAFYGARLTGDEAAAAYAQATVIYQRKMDIYKQQVQVAREAAQVEAQIPLPIPGMPPPVRPSVVQPVPPPIPPEPVEIPVLLQDRILFVWDAMLAKVGLQLEGQVDDQLKRDPHLYLEMRALVAAYKMSAGLGGAISVPTPLSSPSAGAGASPGPPGSGATMAPVDKGSPPAAGPNGQVPPTRSTAPMPGGGAH